MKENDWVQDFDFECYKQKGTIMLAFVNSRTVRDVKTNCFIKQT